MTVAADIESERTALTKSLTTVGASAPTACGNWTAFDLAAHLVSEERLGDRFSSAAEFDNALARPRACARRPPSVLDSSRQGSRCARVGDPGTEQPAARQPVVSWRRACVPYSVSCATTDPA